MRRKIEMRRGEEETEERNDFVEKCHKPKNRQTKCLTMFRKKKTVGRIIRSKVQILTRVFKYLHDSNSIFRPARINSELISVRTVNTRKQNATMKMRNPWMQKFPEEKNPTSRQKQELGFSKCCLCKFFQFRHVTDCTLHGH